MDNIVIEIQARRDPFLDAKTMGELLNEHGFLSVSLVQRKLRMGYTAAARWLDFFVEMGELKLNEENHRYTSLRRTSRSADTACPACSGVGHYLVGNFDETCSECEGTGKA
jgi:hypothetical protein